MDYQTYKASTSKKAPPTSVLGFNTSTADAPPPQKEPILPNDPFHRTATQKAMDTGFLEDLNHKAYPNNKIPPTGIGDPLVHAEQAGLEFWSKTKKHTIAPGVLPQGYYHPTPEMIRTFMKANQVTDTPDMGAPNFIKEARRNGTVCLIRPREFTTSRELVGLYYPLVNRLGNKESWQFVSGGDAGFNALRETVLLFSTSRTTPVLSVVDDPVVYEGIVRAYWEKAEYSPINSWTIDPPSLRAMDLVRDTGYMFRELADQLRLQPEVELLAIAARWLRYYSDGDMESQREGNFGVRLAPANNYGTRPLLYDGPAYAVTIRIHGALIPGRLYVNRQGEFMCSDWCQREIGKSGNGIDLFTGKSVRHTLSTWCAGPARTLAAVQGYLPQGTQMRRLVTKTPGSRGGWGLVPPKLQGILADINIAIRRSLDSGASLQQFDNGHLHPSKAIVNGLLFCPVGDPEIGVMVITSSTCKRGGMWIRPYFRDPYNPDSPEISGIYTYEVEKSNNFSNYGGLPPGQIPGMDSYTKRVIIRWAEELLDKNLQGWIATEPLDGILYLGKDDII